MTNTHTLFITSVKKIDQCNHSWVSYEVGNFFCHVSESNFHCMCWPFGIVCRLRYSININTVQTDPNSDSLQKRIMKSKNTVMDLKNFTRTNTVHSNNFLP